MNARSRPFAAVIAIAVLIASMASASAGAEEERPRRVLMVHSFGASVPPFTTHSTAFESALKHELGAAVDLDQVSLENARYAKPDVEEAFAEFLAKRVAQWQPDLIVPAGAPAGRFVAKYRDKLFPGTPVIYSWVDIRTLPTEAITNNATLVGQSLKLERLVEDILQLDPETKHVVVILGATPLERYWSAEFQKAFAPFAARVKFTFVNDMPFDQILALVSKLPPHSFVQLALLTRDASGVTYNQDEVLKRLSEVSSAPVNGMFQYQVGRGIVGGRLFQDEFTGLETARVAARILRGERASDFPPLVIPAGTPTYDWRELKRWKISESRLPEGNIVMFRQPTNWQRYRWQVAGAVTMIGIQAGMIFALVFQLRRRHVAEAARRRAEADAMQRRDQLAHVTRVASLGELTATLAHELSQPLAAIMNNAGAAEQFLAQAEPDLDELRETMADISSDTQRAGEVIHRLRGMLKQGVPVDFAPLDLNEVIRLVERLVHGDAVRHRVSVELYLAADIPGTVGDRVQLQQVVMNLMLNAFAAMDHPGHPTRRLVVSTDRTLDGQFVEAKFEDTGIGIAADVIDRLFEPFVTTKPDGLGMGLSICRSIIDQHNGELQAANNPHGGATFSVRLPAAPTKPARPTPGSVGNS